MKIPHSLIHRVKRTLLLPPALILVSLTLYAACWPLSDAVIPFDSKTQFYSWVRFAQNSLAAGQSVFWNPYLFLGYPTIADPQFMTWSPGVFAYTHLVESASLWAFDALIFAHLGLAGLGAIVVGRSYGWSTASIVFLAIVLMLGGVAAARLQHSATVFPYAYAILSFGLLRLVLGGAGWRAALGFGVVAGVLALHMTQVALLFVIALTVYILIRLAHQLLREPKAGALILLKLCVAASVAVLVVAPQALPAFANLELTNRSAVSLGEAKNWSLPIGALATVLVPDVFGHLQGWANYTGPADWVESYLYIGMLPLALLLLQPFPATAGRDRWFLAGLLAVGVLFMLGPASPVYRLYFEYLPGAQAFRRPSDGAFVVLFAAAILSAGALETLRGGNADAGLVQWLGRVAIAAVLGYALATAWSPSAGGGSIWHVAGHGLLLIAAFALLMLGRRRQRLLLAIVPAITLADLIVHNAAAPMNTGSHDRYAKLRTIESHENPVSAFLTRQFDSRTDQLPPRVEFNNAGPMWDNHAAPAGIYSTTGYNPLRPAPYDEVVGRYSVSGIPRSFAPLLHGYGSEVFDLTGTRYLVSGRDLAELDPQCGDCLTEVFHAGDLTVWENPDPMPRAFAVRDWVVDAAPQASISQGRLPVDDLGETVILERPPTWPETGSGAQTAPGRPATVSVTTYANARIEMQVAATERVLVVLTDTYHPAWVAEVDGTEVPIYRADYLFRAVPVPAGDHTLTMEFRPYRHGARWLVGKLTRAVE